jgi:hypothetical protein
VNSLADQVRQLDAHAALSLANTWRSTQPGVNATLTARAVRFIFKSGEEVSIPLPADTMILEVAPYLTRTHPCQIHSLSGCRAEMAGFDIKVHAQTPDGTVLMDGAMTAMDNGFIELWLPRGKEIDLTLESAGKKANGRVTTYESSNTCLTGFKLE